MTEVVPGIGEQPATVRYLSGGVTLLAVLLSAVAWWMFPSNTGGSQDDEAAKVALASLLVAVAGFAVAAVTTIWKSRRGLVLMAVNVGVIVSFVVGFVLYINLPGGE